MYCRIGQSVSQKDADFHKMNFKVQKKPRVTAANFDVNSLQS